MNKMNDLPIQTTPLESISPFHSGEQQLQISVGKKDKMQKVGSQFIRTYLIEQHGDFYRGLGYAFIGYKDAQGNAWTSVIYHRSSLLKILDDRNIAINLRELPVNQRPRLTKGAEIGLLGIDLSNKRRNRLTGTVTDFNTQQLTIRVKQSFGNCPKYIQTRKMIHHQQLVNGDTQGYLQPSMTTELSCEMSALISKSDTFFVSSYTLDETGRNAIASGADVSHRGGPPGFVAVKGQKTLIIPDYPGNNFFNTLGNIQATGKAGLMFIDFDTGDILNMTGSAKILPKVDDVKTKVQRFWQFDLGHAYFCRQQLPFTCSRIP